MKIRAYGYLRGHDEMRIAEGSLEERKFTAVYRTGDRLTGVLAVGVPPGASAPGSRPSPPAAPGTRRHP